MSKQFGNFIDGKWVDSDQAIENINPSDTRDVIGSYASASAEQMTAAVAAARRALPAWSATTTQFRSDILARVSADMSAPQEDRGRSDERRGGKQSFRTFRSRWSHDH